MTLIHIEVVWMEIRRKPLPFTTPENLLRRSVLNERLSKTNLLIWKYNDL